MKLKDKLYYSQKGIKVNKQKTAKQELDTLMWATRLRDKMKCQKMFLTHPQETKKAFNKRERMESYIN